MEYSITVSVIITIYNKAPYLAKCLDSVISQSFSNFEIIAYDDCSTDESLYIARQYAAVDNRIKIVTGEENLGVSGAANKAIARARGRYIARMDADDIMPPGRLEKQVLFLEQHTDHVAVGGQVRIINKDGRFVRMKNRPEKHEDIVKSLFLFNPIHHGTIMINRSMLPDDFYWYVDTIKNAEDYDLIFRLVTCGKVHNMEDVFLHYRHLDDSVSRSSLRKSFLSMYYVRKRALQIYKFKPGLKNRILNNMQFLFCMLFPDRLIDFIFNIFIEKYLTNFGRKKVYE